MRILLLDNIGLAGCIDPNKVQHLFKEIAESSPMPNVASPISAFLSLKAVATIEMVTLSLKDRKFANENSKSIAKQLYL